MTAAKRPSARPALAHGPAQLSTLGQRFGHRVPHRGRRARLQVGAAASAAPAPAAHTTAATTKAIFFLPTRQSCPVLLIKKNNKDMENSIISLSSFLDLALANLKQTLEGVGRVKSNQNHGTERQFSPKKKKKNKPATPTFECSREEKSLICA